MTLMLILGAVAAFYGLLLLFRCATYALPVFAGLGLAFALRDHGFSWLTILAAGLLAGVSVHALGRHLARSSAPRRPIAFLERGKKGELTNRQYFAADINNAEVHYPGRVVENPHPRQFS